MRALPLLRCTILIAAAASAACQPVARPARTTLAGQPVTVATREGRIRGHLRDARIGDEVVIVTPTGERRVAWTAITHLELEVESKPLGKQGDAPGGDRFSHPDDRPGEPRESDQAARERVKARWLDGAPDARRVRIVLTGDDEALGRVRYGPMAGHAQSSVWTDYGGARRERICSGPCEVTLDVHPEDVLTLGGRPIALPPGKPEVRIDVRHGQSIIAPTALTIAGALAAQAGVGLLAFGLRNDREPYVRAGAISTGSGVAVAAAGIVWLMLTRSSRVRVGQETFGVVRF